MKGPSDWFEDFDVRIVKERADRLERQKVRCTFGIQFLDDAFKGIFRDDLVVVGAKTGVGKTQLGMLIALANAKEGKNVHYFALEASEFEIERRIKYQEISKRFFALQPNERPRVHLNYRDWYNGDLDEALRRIEESVEKTSFLPQLKIFYRKDAFTPTEFQKVFFAIKADTDLVIIDHLHYFDFEDDNEYRAIKAALGIIRDSSQITNKPVILIAHFRKTDRRLKQIIPDIEDFHGSSDIGKIATKSFSIAPGSIEGHEMGEFQRGTFIRVLKNRTDSTQKDAVGLAAYNVLSQSYERDYYLGELNSEGTGFNPFDLSKIPRWAANALPFSGVQSQAPVVAPIPPIRRTRRTWETP